MTVDHEQLRERAEGLPATVEDACRWADAFDAYDAAREERPSGNIDAEGHDATMHSRWKAHQSVADICRLARSLVDENTALRAELEGARSLSRYYREAGQEAYDEAEAAEAERDALRERVEAVEGGMEQIGWLGAGRTNVHGICHNAHRHCVPVYRLSDAARAALSPQEGTQ